MVIRLLLLFSIYLESITLFWYTLQIIPTLEQETKNTTVQKLYKIYRKVSVWLIPPAVIALYLSLVFTITKTTQQADLGNINGVYYWSKLYLTFEKTLGYVVSVVSLISSVILILTVLQAY